MFRCFGLVLVAVVVFVVAAPSADGVTIISNNFDGDDTNDIGGPFNIVSNNLEQNDTADPSTGLLSFSNANATMGLSASNSFDSQAFSSLTVTWAVSSVTNGISAANGWFFGLQSAQGLEDTGGTLWNNDPDSIGVQLFTNGGSVASDNPTKTLIGVASGTNGAADPEIADGFEVSITLNSDDTYSVSSLGLTNDFDENLSGPFPGDFTYSQLTDTTYAVMTTQMTGATVMSVQVDSVTVTDSGPEPGLVLTIDRQTGAMALVNESDSTAIDLLGYSTTSSAGAFDQSGWTPITGRLDAPSSGGDGSVDSNDAWTVLTAPGSSGDLSEAELVGGDGGTIAAGMTVDFGNVWIPTPTEDVRLQLLLDDGSKEPVRVQYTGEPIAYGDLNADGAIDVNDWVALLVGLNDDLPGLSPAEAYRRGDLVYNDLVTDYADFLKFQQLYEAANGAGSFAAMLANVPEPASGSLLMTGMLAVGLGFVRRRTSRQARRMLVLLILATGLGICLTAAQQATAASIEWGQVFEIFSDADIDTSGEIVAAINGGPEGADAIQVTIGGAVLNFVSPTPSVLPTANAAAGVPTTGNLDLDAVFGSQALTTTADPLGLFTLSGLAAGQDYQVQIIAGADSRACCAARTQFFQDTEDGSGNNSALLTKATDLTGSGTLRANSVIGTFTADGSSQDLWINGEINPAMSAYVVSAIGDIPRLTLEVNTVTGATAIRNDGVDSIDMHFYEIRSESGTLDPDGWDSLDAQNIDATDGNDPGSIAGDSPLEGWDEAAKNSPNVLTEAFLLGQSTFNTGDRVAIGNAYDRQASAEDLVFKFGMPGANFREGTIDYVTVGVVLGDVNLDDEVNGLDVDPFVDVLLNGPFQAEADMNGDDVVNGLDVDPFVAAVVGGGVAPVPEPSTLLLALAALGILGIWRRKR